MNGGQERRKARIRTPARDPESPALYVTFHAASDADAQALARLRVRAMRASLERVGRFDQARARERFLSGFAAQHTRHIVVNCERVGVVVVKARDGALVLEHLYVAPEHQGRGVGAAVLAQVFCEADALGCALHVGALRESDSNRFYRRHGFTLVDQSEFDVHYVRHPINP